MKTYSAFLFLILSSIFLNAQLTGDITFGTTTSLDIVTWNVEKLNPGDGESVSQSTINYVTQIVNGLDADIIALQEINDVSAFSDIIEGTDYNGISSGETYKDVAFLYNSKKIKNVSFKQILSSESSFTSNPFKMTFTYLGQEYILINLHLKCCDDGVDRRMESCIALKSYIDTYYSNSNVIVVGDWNDELTDSYSDNVFQTIIDDPTNYKFADMDIAEGSSSYWSFPNWPSHLDHILITNELFDDLNLSASDIQTLKIDQSFSGGFSSYDYYVSDHRPVGLKLYNGGVNANEEITNPNSDFYVYPNPAINTVKFKFAALNESSRIEIYNMNGQRVDVLNLRANQVDMDWDAQNQPAGVYFAKLISKDYTAETKIVLVK